MRPRTDRFLADDFDSAEELQLRLDDNEATHRSLIAGVCGVVLVVIVAAGIVL
jgi:hypothetical protein